MLFLVFYLVNKVHVFHSKNNNNNKKALKLNWHLYLQNRRNGLICGVHNIF